VKAVKVESSNLAAVAVDGEDLLVRFRSGARYRYPGAAEEAFCLLEAPSAGRYFHAKIRRLPCVRLCDYPGCLEPVLGGNSGYCPACETFIQEAEGDGDEVEKIW